MDEQNSLKRRSPLMYLGGFAVVALLSVLRPFIFHSNLCQSSDSHERGVALSLSGDRAGAIAAFSEYLKAHPGDVETLTDRGVEYVRLKQPDPAIADLTQALQRQPDDYTAAMWRGDAYFLKHDYQDATADYSRAMNKSDVAQGLYYPRGVAYLDAGNYEAAAADFAKALTSAPDNVYIKTGADCASRKSNGGACGSLPLDKDPDTTRMLDTGLNGC
jgi:tetratricopeptide (TPR) repeat protein